MPLAATLLDEAPNTLNRPAESLVTLLSTSFVPQVAGAPECSACVDDTPLVHANARAEGFAAKAT